MWADWALSTGRRQQTVDSYRRCFRELVQFIGPTPLNNVSLHVLEEFLARRPVAPATRQREASQIRSFYAWAERRGHVTRNWAAALEGAKVDNADPKPISDADWQTLWAHDLDSADRVALGLSMYCGLRRQEVCWLRKGQVQDRPAHRLVAVERKGGKRTDLPYMSMVELVAQKLPHLLPDKSAFLDALAEARVGDATDPLVRTPSGAALTTNSFSHRMARLCREAGVVSHPHALRHACATNLIRMGVEVTVVSRLMAHGSLDMTMRYVRHATDPLAPYLTHD